jgi:predicted HTH transcriptional regulator
MKMCPLLLALAIVPEGAAGLIAPAIETQLNARQKKIMVQVQKEGFVTSGWCGITFGVAYQTVYRDLNGLLTLGLVEAIGRGRSTRYIPKARQE